MPRTTYRSVGAGYSFEISYGILGRRKAKKLIRAHKAWVAGGKKGPIQVPDGPRLKATESKVYEASGHGQHTEKFTVRDRWFGRFGVNATYGIRPLGSQQGRRIIRERTRLMGKDRVTMYKSGTYYSVTTGQFLGEKAKRGSTQKTTTRSGDNKITTRFEPQLIAAAVEQKTKNALLRIGYLIRRTAQASLTQRRSVSTPGHPPASHQGTLRNLIMYAWDNASKTVVVGPVRANGPSQGKAPRALEYGGASSMLRVIGGKRKRINISIQSRPYMRPAMHLTLPQYPGFFGT